MLSKFARLYLFKRLRELESSHSEIRLAVNTGLSEKLFSRDLVACPDCGAMLAKGHPAVPCFVKDGKDLYLCKWCVQKYPRLLDLMKDAKRKARRDERPDMKVAAPPGEEAV